MRWLALAVLLLVASAAEAQITTGGCAMLRTEESGVLAGPACTYDFDSAGFDVLCEAGRCDIALGSDVTMLGDTLDESELPASAVFSYANTTINTETGAKTTDHYGWRFANTATSSTASVNKYGFTLDCTGTWDGSGAANRCLWVSASGGTSNVAIGVVSGTIHSIATHAGTLSAEGLLTLGPTASNNLMLDQNDLQARNNGAAATLLLNALGGNITMGQLGTTSVGLNTAFQSLEYSISLGGQAARGIGVNRHSTANTAGNTFTLQAGGATSGATDKAGGSLLLNSGIATGNGGSVIDFATVDATQGAGTTNRTPTVRLRLRDGHLVALGTAPTLGSCGTTPSIVGTDVAGKITIGSGGSTACVVTFAKAFTTNAPICLAQNETSSARIPRPTTSTTALTLSDTLNASDVIAYHCIGRE